MRIKNSSKGRPRRPDHVVLNVAISKVVADRFRNTLGPDRILCRAVEQALEQAIARGATT